jgi:hypothetical protein
MSDTVSIGDLSTANQFFIQVGSVQEKSGSHFGGILGLGHHRTETNVSAPRHSFIWSLFTEHPALPRQFSLFLSDLNDANASELVIGEPDIARHAKEAIRFTKSGSDRGVFTWLASMWSLSFSGSSWMVDFADQGLGGGGALVDSGTSLIVLRPDIFAAMNAEITNHLPANGCHLNGNRFMCNCPASEAEYQALPSLVFTFVSDDLVSSLFSLCLTPAEWLVRTGGLFGATCMSIFEQGDENQPTPVILGMVFIRSFYTTFDVQGQRIGFARSSSSSVPADLMCTVDATALRKRTYDLAIYIGGFVVAVLLGCICGCLICPETSCCGSGMSKHGEEQSLRPRVPHSRTVQKSLEPWSPRQNPHTPRSDDEEDEAETAGFCGFE